MKIHELKIKEKYYKDVALGYKPFELRKNDRDYQKGDLIKYKVVNIPDCNECIHANIIRTDESINENIIKAKSIEKNLYQIVNICDYEQKEGYIVWQEKIIYSKENNF